MLDVYFKHVSENCSVKYSKNSVLNTINVMLHIVLEMKHEILNMVKIVGVTYKANM
jgi:hypothetical protein